MCGRLAVLAGRQNIIDDAIDEWRKCLRLLACIRAKEDILSICFDSRAGHAYDNFSVLSLWILKKTIVIVLNTLCQVFDIFDLLYFAM